MYIMCRCVYNRYTMELSKVIGVTLYIIHLIFGVSILKPYILDWITIGDGQWTWDFSNKHIKHGDFVGIE